MVMPYINTYVDKNLITNMVHLQSGAQGHVYKAEYAGQVVAVKEKWTAFDERIFAKLQHPHIVRVLGLSDRKRFLIMEYCNRQLHIVLHDTPVSPITFRDFKHWTWQIAGAMEFLHGQNIIHRDLKSANVLVALDNGIRLCDFDLSRGSENNNTLICVSRVGTERWMAPEVINKGNGYTKRADVWSYGVVVWEMVTQQIPYLNMNNFEDKYRSGELCLSLPSDFDESYRNVFKVCLNIAPESRPNFTIIRKTLETFLVDPSFRSLHSDNGDWAKKKERWSRQAFNYYANDTDQCGLDTEGQIDEKEVDVEKQIWRGLAAGFVPPMLFHIVGTPYGTRFHVNFEINGKAAFHFNPIFKRRMQVVRNAWNTTIGDYNQIEEECTHTVEFPFKIGRKFDLLFVAGTNFIEIKFTRFFYRNGTTPGQIDNIAIYGNLDLQDCAVMRDKE